MLETLHLRPGDYRVQPWKNGRGETQEIARDPVEPFAWRLSLAKLVEDGPFSPFPGYDRTIVLIDGSPVTLSHGKVSRRLTAFQPYAFRGEWEVQATVPEPSSDFNVFTLRDRARAGVYLTRFGPGEEFQFPLNGMEHFLFGLEGEMQVLEANTNRRFSLAPRETLRFSRTSQKEFLNVRASGGSARGACLWIVVHRTANAR